MLTAETDLVSLAMSPDLRPVRDIHKSRTGSRLSPAQLHRWLREGIQGVKLRAVRIGRNWMTTDLEYATFIAKQSEAALSGGKKNPQATDDELKALGLL